MLGHDSRAYELDAILIKQAFCLFGVREVNLSRCHPKPFLYRDTVAQVFPQMSSGSGSFFDHRGDLVLLGGVGLDGDHFATGFVAKQIVPTIVLLMSRFDCIVQIEAIGKGRSNRAIKVIVVCDFYGGQPFANRG